MRFLSRARGFVVTAVLTLATGIAASVAMFSVYSRVVLNPIAFDDPATLVALSAVNRQTKFVPPAVSYLRFQALQRGTNTFTQLAAYTPDTVNLISSGAAPAPLRALRVSGDFFGALRVPMALGRSFSPADDLPNGPAVCILSAQLWRSTFGASNLVGTAIELNGQSTEVIGVLPPLSTPWADREIFLPRVFEDSTLNADSIANGASFLSVVARLRPTVTLASAGQDVRGVSRDYAQQFAGRSDAANDIVITPFTDSVVGGLASIFAALLAAVAVVLLVACTNTAALVLNQLLSRQRDVSVRYALGASRWTIVRMFVRESLWVSAAAGAAGVILARETLRVLGKVLAPQLPSGVVLSLSPSALGFALAVVIAAGLLVGIVPAVYVTRRAGPSPLVTFVRGMSDGAGARKIRFVLAVCEVGMSVSLVVSAVLLIASLDRLQRSSPGFDPHGVAVGFVNLTGERYATRERQSLLFRQVLERIAASPEVTGAAVVMGLPFDDTFASTYTVSGRPILPASERARAGWRIVSPDYFRVMGIRLVAGRAFAATDDASAPGVCIINQSLARRQFGDRSPLGDVILRGRNANERYEIVGVVADVKTNGLTAAPPDEIFYPFWQIPRPNVAIVAKARQDPHTLEPIFRGAVSDVDRLLAVARFGSMEENLAATLGAQRVLAGVTTAFAALALALASIGLYAVLAHNVSTRTVEIGIRMAVGASRRAIATLVLRQAFVLVSIGIGCGLAVAALGSTAIASQLYGVRPTYPAAYIGVALLFWSVGLAAAVAPVVRATRIDPLRSLNAGS